MSERVVTNGWTGGQYSLFRVVFGIWLAARFATLLASPNSLAAPFLHSPTAGTIVLAVATLLALLLAVGFADRIAAAGLLVALACLAGPRPFFPGLGLAFTAGLLLAHLFLPPAPYGSWVARGRPDPDGGWQMPPPILAAGRILLAVGVAFVGATKGLHAILGSGEDLQFGRVLLLLFVFDPAWIAPKPAAETGRIFYDGHCGLCHRAVRFVLAEDRVGDAFRFAPLESEAFRAAVPEGERAGLPDSIVVRRADGRLLARSAAMLYIGARLGGAWRILAAITQLVPRPLRDLAYDGVARVRYRVFGRPAEACPLIPPALRDRFDA